MAFCENCGNELSESGSSCPRCGHPRTPARTSSPPGAPPVVVGRYAGFWLRLAGLLLDGLILSLLTYRFIVVRRTGSGSVVVSNPVSPVAAFLYGWLMIAYVKGQTLGKMATAIRITRPDGSPVDPARAAARAAMALVSGLAIGLGYLWAAWDQQHRTWHDIVADTRAYRVPR